MLHTSSDVHDSFFCIVTASQNATPALDLFYVSPPIDPLIFTMSGVFLIMTGVFGVFANMVTAEIFTIRYNKPVVS